ncbi:MAG TPA: VOC family protein [Terriglobia bacterium]|nr:VOC family protein [Terriglobia bacterium]
MSTKAKAVPEGFHTITPYLVVRDAAKAVEFYKRAFGAEVRGIHYTPDGKIMNADLKIGDSIVLMSEEFPEMKALSPQSLGGSSVTIHIYTEDVDAKFKQAVSAGATAVMPVMDMFWGDRYGQLADPFGHRWSIATHVEDLTSDEIQKRGQAVFAEMAKRAQHA